MKSRYVWLVLAAAVAVGAGLVLRPRAGEIRRTRTVADRLDEYGDAVRGRLGPCFESAGVAYPPAKVVLVGLKRERQLEVWASGESGELSFVREYPILGASGGPGPKLRQGDRQVPEGIYRIVRLNPNSSYHLSMKIDYPNAFDRAQAGKQGRTNLGGDIFIHGGSASIGCLAMGDEAAEDLFVLAAQTQIENMLIILSPVDFRVESGPQTPEQWLEGLYAEIGTALAGLRR